MSGPLRRIPLPPPRRDRRNSPKRVSETAVVDSDVPCVLAIPPYGKLRSAPHFPFLSSLSSSFFFFFLNTALILSNNSTLAPCLRMMTLCWATESVLFQAQ